MKRVSTVAALIATTATLGSGQSTRSAEDLSQQVEIIRTAHGVPHIRAENLRAAAYALAWVQLEDYGPRTGLNLLRASGGMARFYGYDSIDGDFHAKRERTRAVETFHLLDPETRDYYDGFAAGVNRYIELHRDEFPPGMPTNFTGYDVAARDVTLSSPTAGRNIVARVDSTARQPNAAAGGGRGGGGRGGRGAPPPPPPAAAQRDPNEGSNTWAFAPSRTKSGKAILMRNPHLAWTAGYYEGHVTVPGVLDFYGDFRIGGPFGVIGGFNRDLGWSTTNNAPDLDEVYSIDVDPARVDHYLIDGTSLPLRRELVTVEFKNGNGFSSETREFWSTPMGPVIHRGSGKIYLYKNAGENDFRAGEQFLRMMRAKSFAEFKQAMEMRARINSNFTYADRAGNIYYVWNASLPKLPHAVGGDSTVFPVKRTSDMWTQYVPFDSLPQFFNPRGGYLHNENDAPYYTNVRVPLDTTKTYPNFPRTELDMRSQLAIALIGGDQKYSLEEIVKLKHSTRMLLADRVKKDLIAAVQATQPAADIREALSLIEKWDNTASIEARGAVLFEIWWRRYIQGRNRDSIYTRPWTSADATNTPSGIADPAGAAAAFAWAVPETVRRYGAFDIPWGDVHRVRRGTVDAPVGGCGGDLGCFRVLSFRNEPNGKRAATTGDGWVLAVEFGDIPRAYSVLAYGQSPNESSRWFSDQAEMFAKGEMKKVAFTERDVDAGVVLRYRPGTR